MPRPSRRPEAFRTPKKHFTGYWIPAKVVHLFENGEISLQEMFLLAMIDSLTDHENEKPCWASNEYLSIRMNVTDRNVRMSLSKLKSLGLVNQVGFDGRKRLLVTYLADFEDRKNSSTLTGRILPTYIEEDSVVDSKESTPSPVLGERDLGLVSVNGQAQSSTTIITKRYSSIQLANQLYAKIKEIDKIAPRTRRRSWSKEIMVLVNDYGKEEVQSVIDWYCTNIKGKYTPKAYLATSFRKKYIQIKDAMERDLGPQVKITKTTLNICKRLEHNLNWSVSKDQLAVTVQVSYDNIRKIAVAVRRLRESEHDPIRDFAQRFFLQEETFVENHMRDVYIRLCRRGKWNDLHFYIWEAEDKWVDSLISELNVRHRGIIRKELGREDRTSERKR